MADDRFGLLFVCTANICRSPIAEELSRVRLRAAGAPAGTAITVGSAGTHGRDGAAMDPRAVAALGVRGVRPGDFAARTLTARMVAEADLVLTAQRRHRAAAVALHPPAHAKVFTILEFARLAGHAARVRLAPTPSAPPPGTAVSATERATPSPTMSTAIPAGMSAPTSAVTPAVTPAPTPATKPGETPAATLAASPATRGRELVGRCARLRGTIPPGETGDDIADPYDGPDDAFAECALVIEAALAEPLRLILG